MWQSLQDTALRKNRSRDSARGLPVLHCLGGDAFGLLVSDDFGQWILTGNNREHVFVSAHFSHY